MAIANFLSKASSQDNTVFRDWGSKLSAAIQAVGFVKTSDSGQINWATVNIVAGQMVGYDIFRFNDALQATHPIFIKLEYGNTGGACAGFRVTVGKATDGAGNLSGILHQAASCPNGDQNNTTNFTSYVSSGDGSMLVFSLWPQFNQSYSYWHKFVIERSRDANGNATGDGTFCYRHTAAASNGSRSEATDYVTRQTNIVNRGSIYTGYEIGVSTSLNNGNDTPLFKSEVVTPSRVKWNPLSILGYAYSDAGNLQIIDVEGTNYLTLGNLAGQYADVSLQQYACLAIAYY